MKPRGSEHLIPVSVVTGFLGSGKTTLISRLIRDPAFARTAVIVNEFGEIGLDHDLIASSDDTVVTLSSGCLCCVVQTDLAGTLSNLRQQRDAGSVAYDRVLIETSGLSDPAPVLQGLLADGTIASTHQTPYVVTLVDTVHGEASLAEHVEARHQVAVADCVLLSKTDIQAASVGLLTQLDALNPSLPRRTTIEAKPSTIFGNPGILPARRSITPNHHSIGHNGITTFTVTRDSPMPALALTMLLQAVAEHCGSRMLRLKGLVAIEEMPGRPAMIHGVRHVVSAPEFLEQWPSTDERTRLVFIAKAIPPYFVSRLLDAIDEEVREANTKLSLDH